MTSSKSTKRANWVALTLPFWEEFRATPRPFRSDLIHQIAHKVGKAPNTIYRQMVALAYLASNGVDLDYLAQNHPPLMSVEAIARVGKKNPHQEQILLRRLLDGYGSVHQYRSLESQLYLGSNPVDFGSKVNLSDILKNHLFVQQNEHCTDPDYNSFRGDGFVISEMIEAHQRNSFLIRQGYPSKSSAIIIADERDPRTHARNFDALCEASIIRAVVTFDRVIIVRNMSLPRFQQTYFNMKLQYRDVIITVQCDPVIDFTIPHRDAHFKNLDSFLASHIVNSNSIVNL